MSDRTPPMLVTCAHKSCLLGDYEQARTLLNDALRLNPEPQICFEAALLLAKVDLAEGHWEAALRSANLIFQQEPGCWDALKIRQKCRQRLSHAAEDAADCRLLNQLRPAALEHSDFIFKSNYLWQTTPEFLFKESFRWNDLYAAPLWAERLPHRNRPEPERRLKIGYISPDFRRHAIMRVLPCLFENYERQQFDLFAYFINLQQHDDVTESLKRSIGNFVELPANTHDIANRVRADGIDILVDLAGHTMPVEALLAFALKPAPVQVTWLGVHATTGMRAIDYVLGDAHLPCPGTEHLFSEKVYRMQRAQYCYRPEIDPGIGTSPFFQNGYITFGCFNNPSKVTRELVQAWSVILHLHPGSKLLCKYAAHYSDLLQQRFRDWFQEDGISAERVLFADASWPLPYMASWNRIDIALDTFPYNGGTTTLDALWMGVPVISMNGRLAVSCCGSLFLATLGLPVARTLEQYIDLAREMVKLVEATPDVRQRIRKAMSASELMDEKGFVQALEEAYRAMWRNWCADCNEAT